MTIIVAQGDSYSESPFFTTDMSLDEAKDKLAKAGYVTRPTSAAHGPDGLVVDVKRNRKNTIVLIKPHSGQPQPEPAAHSGSDSDRTRGRIEVLTAIKQALGS